MPTKKLLETSISFPGLASLYGFYVTSVKGREEGFYAFENHSRVAMACSYFRGAFMASNLGEGSNSRMIEGFEEAHHFCTPRTGEDGSFGMLEMNAEFFETVEKTLQDENPGLVREINQYFAS